MKTTLTAILDKLSTKISKLLGCPEEPIILRIDEDIVIAVYDKIDFMEEGLPEPCGFEEKEE